jgi:hypothetical protein
MAGGVALEGRGGGVWFIPEDEEREAILPCPAGGPKCAQHCPLLTGYHVAMERNYQ